MEKYVETAINKGLEEICFTPHSPYPKHGLPGTNLRMDLEEIDIYLNNLERLRRQFKEIKILAGIEADYYKGYEKFLEDFLSRYPFDLVLISIHFIRHWPKGHWIFGFDFPDKTLSMIYKEYFQELKNGIKTGLFDCVAHLDLIKQPGHPVLETNRQDVEEIIDLCCRKKMSIEINTSGFRKDVGEPYPSQDIIPLMIEQGVELIIGSDAHAPQQVALCFQEIDKLLKEFPDARIIRYKKRKPLSLIHR